MSSTISERFPIRNTQDAVPTSTWFRQPEKPSGDHLSTLVPMLDHLIYSISSDVSLVHKIFCSHIDNQHTAAPRLAICNDWQGL